MINNKTTYLMSKKLNFMAMMLLGILLSINQAWGETFTIDFYDSGKLSSTSGTNLTNTNYSSFVQVADGLTATNVVTNVATVGTVQYGKNGGLTLGTGTATAASAHKVTFTIGSSYKVTRCTVYATAYESGRILLNGNAAGSGSLGTKGATIDNVTSPYVWSDLGNLTSLEFTKDNGSGGNQKRITIYRIVCEYSGGGVSSPAITKSSSMTAFSTVYGAVSTAQSFTVGGTNLKADLVVTAPTGFEVCKTSGGTYSESVSFSPTAKTVSNTSVYVRIKNNVNAGTLSAANITCTSTGATTQNVSVSGKVQSKVNWSVNGGAAAGSPTIAVDKDGKVSTLPTDPTKSDCDGSKVFVGWTNTEIALNQKSAPAVLFTTAASAPTVSTNEVTYYAVFATEQVGGTVYKLVTSLTVGNDYIFVTRNTDGSGYALSSTPTTGTAVTISTSSSDKIVSGSPANTIIWTVSSGYVLTNKGLAANNLLRINGSSFTIDGTGSNNLAWSSSYGLYGKSSSGSTKYYVHCGNTGIFSKSTTSSTTDRVYAYEKSGGSTYTDD